MVVDVGTGSGEGRGEDPLTYDAAATSESYGAFKLEQRGIELVPESDRPMKPSGLFWMWAGAI
jgi:hypothetical protein